ncbi:MAG TPA: RNA polymerase sigma-70 factor [Flavitalea sp.]|nr:RNA polymerase sigma-70 factor [Flavitalea sp.]
MQDCQMNAELFTLLAAGDETAFRRVFHYYTPRLRPFVFSIVKSNAVAEEIVQDIFLKLWANREAVAQKENPSSWLFTVAARQSLSFLRHMSVERRYIDSVKAQIAQHSLQNPIEDRLFLREEEALLKKAVEILPPRQKLIYTLSRHEGFSHKQIADQLNISPHTVKNHIITALRTLQDFVRKASIIVSCLFFTAN